MACCAYCCQYKKVFENAVQTGRRGRLSAGKGLASQLDSMQAQLADLDAMWTAVNGPKPGASSGQKGSNNIQVSAGAAAKCKHSKPSTYKDSCGLSVALDMYSAIGHKATLCTLNVAAIVVRNAGWCWSTKVSLPEEVQTSSSVVEYV